MEKMNDLKTLLKHDVIMLESVEEQIVEALPAMAKRATNPALKQALEEHLKVSERQQQRLTQVKQLLGAGDADVLNYGGFMAAVMGGTKCKGIAGIIEEGQKMMAENLSDEVMDAAIIGGSQKIEHFEIAAYGTARTYAEQLGLTDVAQLLQQTLLEEHDADDRLTTLAVGKINQQAQVGASMNS